MTNRNTSVGSERLRLSEDDTRTAYNGSVEFESGESAEALLDQFHEINGE